MIRCGYCGSKPNLPPGYDYFSSSQECLRKGIGTGKHQERREWQVRTGSPVDPPYVSPCPRRVVNSSNLKAKSRYQSKKHKSRVSSKMRKRRSKSPRSKSSSRRKARQSNKRKANSRHKR